MAHDTYQSPLASRYASDYMLRLFSDDSRYQTWRRLWAALARVQHELGLPITEAQAAELEAHITDIDYDIAAQREREVRHDVMAHVYAYGKAAPSAAGIIHLGATSCYVTERRSDPVPGRTGLSAETAAGGAGESGGLRGKIRRHADIGLHPLSAGAARHRGQAGHAVDAGPAGGRGGAGPRAVHAEIPGLPRHHGHRGQLYGPV